MGESIMSFDKYIDNPSGEASVVTNRQMYKAMYTAKFDKVLLREQGRIEYAVYRAKDETDSYYIHIKVPSEVIDKFYYDVVIRLFTRNNAYKTDARLRKYSVQFYSNDPAFVYTFAHSFAKNHLFIDDLEPKMSKVALSQAAKTRNPKDNVWYVKSLYFAYLTMEKYGLFNRINLDQAASPYHRRSLLGRITRAEEKIKAREDAQEKLNKEKAKEKERKAKEAAAARRTDPHATPSTKVSHVTTTAKTSIISKKTSTVKRTKKI